MTTYAWNATGHRLIAQIAYDNMTPEARALSDRYNKSLDNFSKSSNFVLAATWLDKVRLQDIHWFDHYHYIDIPFSKDGSMLPAQHELNALWAIKQAMGVLSSPKSTVPEKGLSLRILIHVVGDIHQPLHAATLVSDKHPQGDLGGNLFPLAKNPIGNNLHQYWDNGGGVLLGSRDDLQLRNKAQQLEAKWTCPQALMQKKPEQWIKASHQLARKEVYTLLPYTTPGKRYQLNAQNISQKQILFAGCRLASLLNSLA